MQGRKAQLLALPNMFSLQNFIQVSRLQTEMSSSMFARWPHNYDVDKI